MSRRTSRREIYSALKEGRARKYSTPVSGGMFGNKRFFGTKVRLIAIKEKGYTRIVDFRRK